MLEMQNEKFLLDLILEETDDAIVYVDKNAKVKMLSDSYAKFLKVSRSWAINRHITEVIPNTRLHKVLESKITERGKIQEINGQAVIADRIPIFKNGEVIGVYGRVLFRSIEELTNLHEYVQSFHKELNLYKEEFNKTNRPNYSLEDILGSSPEMERLKKLAIKVANTTSTVLILGESGTGKELFAHSIHQLSRRKNEAFIQVDCGSIPADLLESELFGYVEGAFTGAKKGGKIGKFTAANKGTIFLDEIGNMSYAMQGKLLRVLQEKEIHPVGSIEPHSVDIRVIAATNKNLEQMVKDGSFREDLYFRLNVVSLNIPPLRERKDDIILLANHIGKNISKAQQIRFHGFLPAAMKYLISYDYPGNVRELKNIIEGALNYLDYDEYWISVEHLSKRVTGKSFYNQEWNLKESLEKAESKLIDNALLTCDGNRTKAAELLGISRTTLYEKMKKLEL